MIEKKKIRRRILKLRDGLSSEERGEKSKQIKKKLFTLFEFTSAKTVFFYAAKRSEVATKEMIEDALSLGKKVGLPIVRGKEIFFSQIFNYGKLIPSTFGILEPEEEHPISLDRVDLIIVPGIVFDSQGNRIGFGKGFYDRFLKKIPDTFKIGLAFEIQIVETIPKISTDIPVDKIITEKRVIDYGV